MQNGIFRFGGHGMCQKDFQVEQRKALAKRRAEWGKVPKPLPESELARLRLAVGLDPALATS